MSVCKSRITRRFQAESQLLLNAVQHALVAGGFRITQVDPYNYRVRASSSVSWLSWGENLYVQVFADGSVEVLSECSMPIQLIDWGKNRGNVDRVFRELSQLVPLAGY